MIGDDVLGAAWWRAWLSLQRKSLTKTTDYNTMFMTRTNANIFDALSKPKPAGELESQRLIAIALLVKSWLWNAWYPFGRKPSKWPRSSLRDTNVLRGKKGWSRGRTVKHPGQRLTLSI
jgi:hypothetical protein